MNTQNKFKIGIGTAVILLIAFYTYGLFIYGGEYLSGIEYITQVGIIALFPIPVILISKLLLPRKKWVSLSLIGIISILGVFIISEIVGKSIKYNIEMLVISMWPLLCYVIAKHIKLGEKSKLKSFVLDCVSYNIVVVGFIWILEEIFFKYNYISADVIAEMYMYIISVIAFLLYNIKVKKIKPDKWDIFCFVVIVGMVISFWVCKQERIATIIESINYSKTDVDADGDFLNWISHRISMVQASVNGDFSGVNIHRVLPMVNGCSLAWLSSVGGAYVSVVLWVIIAAMAIMLIVYARNKKDVMISVIAYGLVLKTVIGAVANMFLIFSTSVGVPFIKSSYDLIPFAILLFLADSEKNKRPYSNLEQG